MADHLAGNKDAPVCNKIYSTLNRALKRFIKRVNLMDYQYGMVYTH